MFWVEGPEMIQEFQSTLSLRRATPFVALSDLVHIFQSTLSLRRATAWYLNSVQYEEISIHALLAESDMAIPADANATIISIHALLAESDSKYHQIGPIVSV